MASFTDVLLDYSTDESFEVIGRINEELRNFNYFSLLTIYFLLCDWQDGPFCRQVDKVVTKAFKESSEESSLISSES